MRKILHRVRKFLHPVLKYTSPTAAWNAQADVHHATDAELASDLSRRRLIRSLFGFAPLLCLMPLTNILVRHCFTLAGLTHLMNGDRRRFAWQGVRAFQALTAHVKEWRNGPLIEGYSYLCDIAAAIKFYARCRGPIAEIARTQLESQVSLFRQMTGPTGHVYAQETYEGVRLVPSPDPFFTCEAFTVCRRGGGFTLVHHDVRVRWWRFRWNFHVENTFGRVVHGPEDWAWYTGWPNKRISFWWRVCPPRMKIIERSEERVVLQHGREQIEVVFGP